MTLSVRRVLLRCLVTASVFWAADGLADPVAKVCLLLPLSGPLASVGQGLRALMEKMLSEEGVGYVALDTAAEGANALLEHCRQAGGAVGVGGIGDKEAIGLAEAAEAQGFSMLTLGRVIPDRNFRHVIWVATPRADLMERLAAYAVEQGKKYAYVVAGESKFSKEVSRLFGSAFTQRGGEIRLTAALGKDDFAKVANLLAQARGEGMAGQDVLFLGVDLQTSRRLLGFLEFEGIKTRGEGSVLLLGTSLWGGHEMLSRMGNALDGAVFADLERPAGLDPLESDARAAAKMAVAFLKSETTPDAGDKAEGRKALAETLEGMKFAADAGDLQVKGGRVTGRKIVLYEIRSGAPVEVAGPDSVERNSGIQ